MNLNKCDAAATLTPSVRRLHQRVLTTFADTGQPPPGLAGAELAELINRDLLAVDEHGEIRAAYPFSPTPTPHRVTWEGGPTVYAMCAVDALGMSAMLDRPVTITSTEPGTGAPITVEVDHDQARWHPDTAVMFAGTTGDACCPAVDQTCGHINFFTTAAAANAWAAAHPEITGTVLDQAQALSCGIAEFGQLLDGEVQRAVNVIRVNFALPDFIAHVYRLLAGGAPVELDRLAAAGGWALADVRAELDRQPGTEWDEHGRLVGFGVTLRETPHAFHFDGRTLYGYCATAILELPVILGRSGVGESRCAATGHPIRLDLTPDGVANVDPAAVVVSKVRPAGAVTDIRAEICDLGNFFVSPEAAAGWLAQNPEGTVDPVAEEFAITHKAMTELGWAGSTTLVRSQARSRG